MAFDFLGWAALFALPSIIFGLLFGLLVVKQGLAFWKYQDNPQGLLNASRRNGLYSVILFTVFAVVFFVEQNVRHEIDTPINRAVIEYQNNDDPIVINTPPPRTEKLEGFEPLKTE